MRIAPVLAVAAALVACGKPEVKLTLTAQPATVKLSENAAATLTVSGTWDDGPLLEGSEITIDTDEGLLYPTGADSGTEGANTLTVAIKGTKAQFLLRPDAAFKPAKATVTAQYIDAYARTHVATATVTFVAQQVVSLHFSCNQKNVGAFITTEDLQVMCVAAAYDAENHWVKTAHVKFLAEAGGFFPSDKEDSLHPRGQYFVYNPRQGGKLPKDVTPLGDMATGEPRWTDESGIVRNPRDGLASLVAYVEGEPMDDRVPWIDANDNDAFDDGEECPAEFAGNCDTTQSKYLWKTIKILWTDTLCVPSVRTKCPATKLDPVGVTIARGDAKEFMLTLLDKNLNVLAGNTVDSSVVIESPSSGAAILGGGSASLQRDNFGMDIDPSSFKLRSGSRKESYQRQAQYPVIVKNNRTPEDTEPPEDLILSVTVDRTYALDDSGTSGSTITEELSQHVGSLP